jgi:hypothetical protein
MRLIKQFLFISILAVVFGAQAATPAPTSLQLDSPLNTLVIYSGAAITMGASSIVGGDLHVVEGATLGASAEFKELTQLQATLSAEVAPIENQLIATMPADRTLKAGVYHAADLTTTAGITLTFDGENKDGNWLINADTYIAFGAGMKMC